MSDDFYVGYVPKAPASLARWIIRIVAGLLLAGLAIGAALILDQPPFAPSKFEYGIYREASGVIEEWPYPMLRAADATFLLVAPGKHGFSNAVQGLGGQSVRLKGSLIERGSDRMLEVVPGTIETISTGRDQNALDPIQLGSVKLRGEIVDSKCYLGVMNPGSGKVHRDCAARCISGGIPPAFIARDASGNVRTLLLVDSDGRALSKAVLTFVAEPLEISGDLVRWGATLVLKADPIAFHRLSGINSPTWCIR